MIKWAKEKEKLEKLINKDKVSYQEIGRMYGVTGTAVKNAAKRLRIDLPKRREINPKETFNRGTAKIGYCRNCGKEIVLYKSSYGLFCSVKCSQVYKHKEIYKKICDGDEEYMRANYSPKNFKTEIIQEQGNKCAVCGIEPTWTGKELVFVLDHIDCNAANNKRNNLRCVCPNCDSQLPTYKAKNKNGARHYYRYRFKLPDELKNK